MGEVQPVALMFCSNEDPPERWGKALTSLMPDLDFRVWPEVGDPAEIDVALVWKPPRGELRRYPNLKAILLLGAGVDAMIADDSLPMDVPMARMVDPSLTRGMTEYVLLAVLRHHRLFDHYARVQREGRWDYIFPPQASERRVGVMGLGVLGADAARTLAAYGFPVAGWSRTPKELAGIECFAGEAGFGPFLARTDILVCLVPLTPATAGILNAETFARLPKGAVVINVGRGGHLVEEDLIPALDSGQLAGATLDVFREEPLPPEHPFWRHPKILVTPHVASWSSTISRLVFMSARFSGWLLGRSLREARKESAKIGWMRLWMRFR
jgi:glyoxylate/hydroxypyruvate reductase